MGRIIMAPATDLNVIDSIMAVLESRRALYVH